MLSLAFQISSDNKKKKFMENNRLIIKSVLLDSQNVEELKINKL